ncbi:uncharacterized protein [Asterias amurensis]|uniref:uncharacterized protein n=1 Tax=Asterias amurensis TaxID=7602 RepID=UPI003AB199C2
MTNTPTCPSSLFTPLAPFASTPHQMAATQPIPLNPFSLVNFDSPSPPPQLSVPSQPSTYTSHQIRDVQPFSGSTKHGPRIEDWVRDIRYLLQVKGPQPEQAKFAEVVRHTKGDARDVVLNLESRGPSTAEDAICELLEEFGDGCAVTTPISVFFARRQRPDETATEYAIALEALLRKVEDVHKRQGRPCYFMEDRDALLTVQFMSGLHDDRIKQRLAPMQPRKMSFKALRSELRIVAEEVRQARTMRRHTFQLNQQSTEQKTPVSAADVTQATSKSHDLGKQIGELSSMMHQHMTAIDHVLQGQHSLGQRVQHLEDAMSRVSMKAPWMGPTNSGLAPTPAGRCYNCGETGHYARQCGRSRRQPQVERRNQNPLN